jgi:hypothetical protein
MDKWRIHLLWAAVIIIVAFLGFSAYSVKVMFDSGIDTVKEVLKTTDH